MIDPSIVDGLARVVEKARGAPQFGVPQSDLVLVRASNLKVLLDEVRILDVEIREFIEGQDVKVEEVHQWYYDQIRQRLEREGTI